MIHSVADNKYYYSLGRRAKKLLAPSLTGLWIIFYIGDDLKKFAGTPFSYFIFRSNPFLKMESVHHLSASKSDKLGKIKTKLC
ncbi:MAG: hypothetical protein ACOC44_19145, partial [Promethearchaeia archaeon]